MIRRAASHDDEMLRANQIIREAVLWIAGFVFGVMVGAMTAHAQPAPPAMLEKAVGVLAAQRDAAANAHANAETRALMCTDENAALKKRIEELEAAAKPKPE